MTDPIAERTRLYETAADRSGKDPAFRDRLIADAQATLDALAAELKISARVPDGVDIEVVDCTNDKLFLVLPPLEDPPLSDTELERIAGGANLPGSATLQADAHGCPACPHTCVGPAIQVQTRRREP